MRQWQQRDSGTVNVDPVAMAAEQARLEERRAAAMRVIAEFAERHGWPPEDQLDIQGALGLG